jgi:hypothetical protein
MNESNNTLAMTDADRAALRKSHFVGWTLFSRMLIVSAVIFGGACCWLGWEAIHDKELMESLGICTVVLLVLIAFAVLTVRHTRKQIDAPIAKDLAAGIKIFAVGQVIDIKHVGEYNSILVFASNDGQTKEFNLTMKMLKECHDALIVGKEVAVEYSPHRLFLFSVKLVSPLSAEEIAARHIEETNALTSTLIIVSALAIGIGWYLDIVIPMLIISAASIAIVMGVVLYLRKK